MSGTSAIEWTDATWNPVTGCSKVSQGCKNCYALREWPRLSAPRPKPNVYTGRAFTDVMTHPERLDQPLRWKKPRRIFVNSMSDLFHEAVPYQFIVDVFGIMQLAHWHTFQVLTKRPERMLKFAQGGDHGIIEQFKRVSLAGISTRPVFDALDRKRLQPDPWKWPPPNVWLGTSVEDQATADERIPLLLQTPAAVRFISAEPLLGPIWLTPDTEIGPLSYLRQHNIMDDTLTNRIDWVIAGGESGTKARPSHPDWFRSLRDQCQDARVPFFFKQWGQWCPAELDRKPGEPEPWRMAQNGWHAWDVTESLLPPEQWPAVTWRRLGKRLSGRHLDGREWNDYPK